MERIGSDILGKVMGPIVKKRPENTRITKVGTVKDLRIVPISEIVFTEGQFEDVKTKEWNESKAPPVELLGKRFPTDKYLLLDGRKVKGEIR
jgi:hypothetical protein